MKNSKKSELSMPASWRNLKKSPRRKGSSGISIRRRWVAMLRVSLGLVAISLAGILVFQTLKSDPNPSIRQRDFTGPFPPVKNLIFSSDGVLKQRWFMNWLGPLRGSSINELNIEKIHHNLVTENQIVSARVSRKFPDSLVVSIKEHEPLLVLRIRNENKSFTDWLVAADGSLYEGAGYSRNRLKLLPSLKIDPSLLRKNSESGNFYPLEGMPHVSPLLELARRDYPDLYRQWKVVAYERPYDADLGAYVSVSSKKVGTIRFSPQNYSSQLKRLQYLLNEQRFAQVPYINSVDLSHGRSVFTSI